MSYRIIRRKLIDCNTDVIVCPAMAKPASAPGLELEVYRAAGFEEMDAARKLAGVLKPGDVFVTPGFSLYVRHVIHVVLPKWVDGLQNEDEAFRACYRNVFKAASELRAGSLALPVFGLNMYRFPAKRAMDIAIDETSSFLTRSPMNVGLVLSDNDTFSLSYTLAQEIEEVFAKESFFKAGSEIASIDEAVKKTSESFAERFFRMVDEKGFTDSEVYNRANVHRRIISRLRTDPEKGVSKDTAISLAIALKLTLDETKEFIGLAGWALSESMKFDRIIRFFLEKRRYNLAEINEALFLYCGRSLGE